jgi:hypothetical protein
VGKRKINRQKKESYFYYEKKDAFLIERQRLLTEATVLPEERRRGRQFRKSDCLICKSTPKDKAHSSD